MELRLVFTEFVFAFCAVALVDRIRVVCANLAWRLGLRRSAVVGPTQVLAAGESERWYVFFAREDLTGPAGDDAAPTLSVRPAPRRAVPDRRPRLRV